MRSSKPFVFAAAIAIAGAGVAAAAHVDFNDPRRALGRDGDIRIDAELAQETVSPNAPVTVTYQIQNMTSHTIAFADKVADTDYDPDSQTITLSIGSEIPPNSMPHLATINPGEKRVFTTGALLHIAVPNVRARGIAVPRYVQVKVTLLRDVTPFAKLIDQQSHGAVTVAFPAGMFDHWVDGSDSILLNTIPVYWRGEDNRASAEHDRPAGTD